MKSESTGHSLIARVLVCVGAPFFLTLRANRGISPARSGRWRKRGGLPHNSPETNLSPATDPSARNRSAAASPPLSRLIQLLGQPVPPSPTWSRLLQRLGLPRALAPPCRDLTDMEPLTPATWPTSDACPTLLGSQVREPLAPATGPTLDSPTWSGPPWRLFPPCQVSEQQKLSDQGLLGNPSTPTVVILPKLPHCLESRVQHLHITA